VRAGAGGRREREQRERGVRELLEYERRQRQHHKWAPLLFFRELVLAVEERVKSGWTDAGRLHQSFSQSIERVLTYDYAPDTEHVWPPLAAADTPQCNELHELLAICIETTQVVFDCWLTLTLTHER
jgi:hypothetical protein